MNTTEINMKKFNKRYNIRDNESLSIRFDKNDLLFLTRVTRKTEKNDPVGKGTFVRFIINRYCNDENFRSLVESYLSPEQEFRKTVAEWQKKHWCIRQGKRMK